MTDQGRGYGAAPWDSGQPQHEGPLYGNGNPYAQQYPQQGWSPDPYGGQYPQQSGQPQYGQPQQGYQQPQPAYPQQPDATDWAAEAAALDAQQAHEEPYEAHEEPYAEDEEPYAEDEQAYAEEEDGGAGLDLFGEEETSRSAERRRDKKAKKSGRRNGFSCLLVSLVLLGGVGVGGVYGYNFYESRFGPPPDYAGSGTGSVQVTIPDGASGLTMADTLYNDGVIKSAKAFVSVFNKSTAAQGIQAGAYTMQLRMSAASALDLLVSAAGGNTLIIPEGLHATAVYPLIDKKLGLSTGSTAAVAKQDVKQLGLPSYADGHIEGFLWPTRYSITKGMQPLDVLKQMVSNAVTEYQGLQLDSGASGVQLTSGYQVLIEASIVEAEGNNSDDYAKIARVLYNRLNGTATQGKLQLDTTLQYYLGRTSFTNIEKNTLSAGGYNTYLDKGLPPGPIDNPGLSAIKAVLNPTAGDWVYFVAVTSKDTRFDVTFDDFKKDVKDYCTVHNMSFNSVAAQCY